MKNVIILGSGRSGTSMLAGTLSNSGYYMGKNSNYLGVNQANPQGFHEDYEINTINEDILKYSLPVLPEFIRKKFFPHQTTYRFRWLQQLPIWFPIRSNEKINKRISNLTKLHNFCYKDPRFSYTLPIWIPYLKETKFIVVYRHPNITVESILRECKESYIDTFIRIDQLYALNLWKRMYGHILKNYNLTTNKDQWLFIHYDQLLSNEGIKLVEGFLHINLDRSFIDSKISRSSKKNMELIGKVKEIYKELNSLSMFCQ